jgi:hypothetical protein
MSDELGKIEKPAAGQYQSSRKLFFVPLVFAPAEAPAELSQRIDRYWEQAETHVTNLETKLEPAGKVYHEMVAAGGEEGAKAIEQFNKGSYQMVKTRLAKGATLEALEDSDILTEFIDWGRCLALGLQNQNVFNKISDFYSQAEKKRNEHMTRVIDGALKAGESGLLLMMEGQHIQFPSDIQVFYVAPPALDEIKQWLRSRRSEPPAEEEKTADQETAKD